MPPPLFSIFFLTPVCESNRDDVVWKLFFIFFRVDGVYHALLELLWLSARHPVAVGLAQSTHSQHFLFFVLRIHERQGRASITCTDDHHFDFSGRSNTPAGPPDRAMGNDK